MATLLRPESLDEASRLLAELDDAQLYAGGTAIQILKKQGLLFTESFVDLTGVPGLADLEWRPDGVLVGALVSARRMETDPRVRAEIPLVATAYGKVANARVRNTATVGGNIAHGDHRLDPPTALLVMDAVLHTASVRGKRQIKVREFFTGFQETALDWDEIVTGIWIPKPSPGAGVSYVKLTSLGENDWPSASVACQLLRTSGGATEITLGIAALAMTPILVQLTTEVGDPSAAADQAAQLALDSFDPIDDVRGSAHYKRKLGVVAVRDAVRAAWNEWDHA
jgi:carbon-monoxide dehydrogenase medium subunit